MRMEGSSSTVDLSRDLPMTTNHHTANAGQTSLPNGYTYRVLVLQILQGPDRGKKFELPAHEPQLIGRSSEALPITDSTVSRRHAELTPDDGRWYLRDLESANGTFVNGQRIKERVLLSPGDQIRCGSTLLAFAVTQDEDQRSSPVALMPAEAFDVTVES